MVMHRKAYRFRLRPTRAQEAAMHRQAGACRWVWNWALARRREHYAATGGTLNAVSLGRELTAMKGEAATSWLGDVARRCLDQTLRNLDRAFINFFEKRSRYPRFKSRKRSLPAFRCKENVHLVGDLVTVPKIGRVRIRGARPIEGKPKSATFKCDALGRWHVAIVSEFEMPDIPLPAPDPARVVGVDLGLKNFAVLSTGERVAAPKFLARDLRKLRRAQRAASRGEKGSNRRAKAKARVAQIHARIKDRRGDFLHKLTTRLVREHDGLCIEDLCVKGLARTKLARDVHDAAWGEFRRQLAYKAAWNRRHLVVVDRFFPSTRLCRGCGAVNAELTLADRRWACACGMEHDRDLSAAINLRDEGLRRLAGGHPESLNARGAHVRPATAGGG